MEGVSLIRKLFLGRVEGEQRNLKYSLTGRKTTKNDKRDVYFERSHNQIVNQIVASLESQEGKADAS